MNYIPIFKVTLVSMWYRYGCLLFLLIHCHQDLLQFGTIDDITRCNGLLWCHEFNWVSFFLTTMKYKFCCAMYSYALSIIYVRSLFRAIVMYRILPETEGRTLEDIEMHFSDDTKGIRDIHIPKNAKSNKL